MSDALLTGADVEEALSVAYIHAVAAGAGYTVAKSNFDRTGVDVSVEAGEVMRPKLDLQLKATINLGVPQDGIYRYACPLRNYEELRTTTQTPRLLVVLALPPARTDWLTVGADELVMRRCAYWVSLHGAPETENLTSVTVSLPAANRLDVEALQALMEQSRTGRIA
jgi:Domain of unknown function (DUF4365)